MNTKMNLKKSERGQSLVEMAVSMVIMLTLLAGAVDFGRAFFTYMAMRDAAQEGAVFGAICPEEENVIEERVRASSHNPVDLSDESLVFVSCDFIHAGVEANCVGQAVPGDKIKIGVTMPDFEISMPMLGTILGTQHIQLHAEVVDTVLRDECP